MNLKKILFFLFISNLSYGKTLIFSSKKSCQQTIQNLRKKNIEYTLKKVRKKVQFYNLLIEEGLNYPDKKTKNITYFNKKKYVNQYSSRIKKQTQRVYEKYLKNGLDKSRMRIIKNKKNVSACRIEYTNEESVGFFKWIGDHLYLSQSNFTLDYQYSVSQDKISSLYGNFLSGLDFQMNKFELRAKYRIEYFGQEYSLNLNGEDKKKYYKTNPDWDEVYTKFSLSNQELTLGKQLFSWGVFDELSIFDRVNIKNLERFIFDYGPSLRRPISAIRYQYFFENSKIDIYLDLGLDERILPGFSNLWSGIDKKNGLLRGVFLTQDLEELFKNVMLYRDDAQEKGYGVRLSKTSSFGDFSLNFLSTYSDNLSVKLSEELKNEIKSGSVTILGLQKGAYIYFPIETILGVDYTNTFGSHLLKLELGLLNDFNYMDNNFNTQKQKKILSGLGGEVEFESMNIRLYWQYSREDLTVQDSWGKSYYHKFFWQASGSYLKDKLELGFRQILFLSDKSLYSNLYLEYDFTDNDKMQIGGHIFNGDIVSFFGYHQRDNFVNLKFVKSF